MRIIARHEADYFAVHHKFGWFEILHSSIMPDSVPVAYSNGR